MPETKNVVICGGGLAGLTLALQLVRRLPGAPVTVLERTRRPLPEAAHKVGESSVEVGARYFGDLLGLRPYLLERHLPKNGLRFFSGQPGAPLEERTEMGPREPPRVPAYQIDRGRFENDLRERCVAEGVDLREGWGVRDVELGRGDEPHRVIAVPTREGAGPVVLPARWVIDATGRRRMLVKKLGLHVDMPDQASSCWFRVAERVKIAELASDAASEWRERDIDGTRWLSTVHLCGTGYWVWLIPLGSGGTSIGIVAESACHEYSAFSTEEAARRWIQQHEPALARRIRDVPSVDFIAMKDYRHNASRVFSADRWAAVGEAGVFVDPLYSPGSDMIALGNSITLELLCDDLSGDGTSAARVDAMDGFYRDWAKLLSRTLCLGSRTMGAPEVFGAKLYWDYFYYWAFMCPYFFRGLYGLRGEDHARFHRMLSSYASLNERAQAILSAWTDVASAEPITPFVGLPAPATTLSDLHLALLEERDADTTYGDMQEALAWGEELVLELFLRAMRRAGPSGAAALAEKVRVAEWAALSESRLDADEATPKQRRKLLSRPIRDMERSIGRNAPASADAPRLRELWRLAVG